MRRFSESLGSLKVSQRFHGVDGLPIKSRRLWTCSNRGFRRISLPTTTVTCRGYENNLQPFGSSGCIYDLIPSTSSCEYRAIGNKRRDVAVLKSNGVSIVSSSFGIASDTARSIMDFAMMSWKIIKKDGFCNLTYAM